MEDSDGLKNFLEKRIKEMDAQSQFITNKIEFWDKKISTSSLSSKDKNKNKSELRLLGNFIYSYNQSLNIIDGMRESPDFIINDSEFNIGVELREINMNQELRKIQGIIKSIFRDIERELKSSSIIYSGTYSINFFPSTIFKNNVSNIRSEIIDLIKNRKSSGKFIKDIILFPSSNLSIVQSEAYVVGDLTEEIAFNAILEKEEKFESYKKQEAIEKLWLLLTIDGVGEASDYSDIDDNLVKKTFDSKFDKIFILNVFKNQFIEIKVRSELI